METMIQEKSEPGFINIMHGTKQSGLSIESRDCVECFFGGNDWSNVQSCTMYNGILLSENVGQNPCYTAPSIKNNNNDIES